MNRLFYKFTYCNKFGHLEPFSFNNLKRFKCKNIRPYGRPNALRPNKTWVPKGKPQYVLQECFTTQSLNGYQKDLYKEKSILSSIQYF